MVNRCVQRCVCNHEQGTLYPTSHVIVVENELVNAQFTDFTVYFTVRNTKILSKRFYRETQSPLTCGVFKMFHSAHR